MLAGSRVPLNWSFSWSLSVVSAALSNMQTNITVLSLSSSIASRPAFPNVVCTLPNLHAFAVLPNKFIDALGTLADAVFSELFGRGYRFMRGNLIRHDEDDNKPVLFVGVDADAHIAGHSIEKFHPVFYLLLFLPFCSLPSSSNSSQMYSLGSMKP